METWYQVVMNSDENPLHVLAPAQRFQIMVFLSLMWTTIFCSAVTAVQNIRNKVTTKNFTKYFTKMMYLI